jgi:hypothetical protein
VHALDERAAKFFAGSLEIRVVAGRMYDLFAGLAKNKRYGW